MKFNKIIISLATFAFVASGLLVVPVVAVHAEDQVTQKNDTTGNNSLNKNKAKIKREQEIKNKAKAKVKNNVVGVANTGGNEAKNNTTGGGITSGAVNGGVTLDNTVNQNPNAGCVAPEAVPVDVNQTNDTTGNNSDNINKVKVTDTFVCKDISKAKVKNDVNLTSNTGDNKTSGNTVGGDITSGGVTFTIGITNTVN